MFVRFKGESRSREFIWRRIPGVVGLDLEDDGRDIEINTEHNR